MQSPATSGGGWLRGTRQWTGLGMARKARRKREGRRGGGPPRVRTHQPGARRARGRVGAIEIEIEVELAWLGAAWHPRWGNDPIYYYTYAHIITSRYHSEPNAATVSLAASCSAMTIVNDSPTPTTSPVRSS